MKGWEDVTEEDIIKRNTKVIIQKASSRPIKTQSAFEKPLKSKYGAKKTEENGITFDSKREANRYKQLKLLEQVGKIDNLELQVEFELQPAYEIEGERKLPIKYVADFVYTEDGKMIVEDAKGLKTDVYKLKRKMFEYKYKTKIKEV